jgi:hypothetical protein
MKKLFFVLVLTPFAASAAQLKYSCKSLDGIANASVAYDSRTNKGQFKISGEGQKYQYPLDKYSHETRDSVEYDLFYYTISATGEKSVLAI